MPYVKKIETKRTKDGKPQPSYQVRWQEPERDAMGRGIPCNPERPDGQKQQVHYKETYASREAAQERCDELNAARHFASAQSASEMRKAGDEPFGYYASAWLDSMEVRVHRGALKSGTLDEYRRLLTCYVLDQFGSKAVASITPRHCEQFLSGLMQRGIAPKTTKHAWSAFGRVMKYAMTHGGISSNPAERVDFGGGHAVGDHEKFEHHPLTAEQVGKVAAVVGERYPAYALLTLFLAYSGLRSAECSGLEVSDLTFKTAPSAATTASPSTSAATGLASPSAGTTAHAGTGSVRCSVNVRRTKTRRAGTWETSTPKSKRSRRTVPLPPWLAERMRAYIEEHPRADEPTAPLWPSRGRGGRRVKGEQAVAPMVWGEPVALGTFYETILMPAYEAVGLPVSHPAQPARPATETEPARPATPAVRGVRLHDLRATFATMQLMSGVHFMQVSRWLGHGTFTLTLDTYGDWIPEEDGGAGNQLPEPTAPAPIDSASAATPSNVVQMFDRRSAG